MQEVQKACAHLPTCHKDTFGDPAVKGEASLFAEVLSTSLTSFIRNCQCWERKDLLRQL